MSWNGVKKQSYEQEIKSWCDEMGIKNYNINSKGEINVNRNVDLAGKDFKELPYKFGRVDGYFSLGSCKNLTSLKNCPDYVGGYFACNYCPKLDSLEGCPKEVGSKIFCSDCKRKFTQKEVESLCKVRSNIINNIFLEV